MDALEAIQTRNSSPRLTGEVSDVHLQEILKAGLRAPDHAQLRPWRILVIQDEARARLGDLFVKAQLDTDPDHAPEKLEKLSRKPFRAPVVMVIVARITSHPKVPEVEQVLSAGAVVQNMLIAAHALDLGGMWRTGSLSYHPTVMQGLGLNHNEKIVGFLYLGEVDGRRKSLQDMDIDNFVTHWEGS